MRVDPPKPSAIAEPGIPDTVLAVWAKQDRDAFEPLYGRYFDRVFRYCFFRIGDWQEAEDAAQEIFAKALTGLTGFRDVDREDGFRCWLFTIARNHVLNYRRTA